MTLNVSDAGWWMMRAAVIDKRLRTACLRRIRCAVPYVAEDTCCTLKGAVRAAVLID